MKKENSSTNSSTDTREKESKRILDRVANEGESVGTSSLARTANRVSNHFSGADNPQDDKIEIIGKRIGRGLSAVAFIILAVYLANTYILN